MATKKASKKSAVKKKKTNTKFKSPAERVEKSVIDKTLKGVNVLLKASGKPELKELPKGIPGSACNCPIAVALKPIGVTSVDGCSVFVKTTNIATTVVETTFTPLAKPAKPSIEKDEIDLYDNTDLPAKIRNAIDIFSTFVKQFDDNELGNIALDKKVAALREQRDKLDDEINAYN